MGDTSRTTDRRTLIKRAAVVGGAAWVAPVVLGSVASPAGALTAPSCANAGTYRIQIDRGTSCARVTPNGSANPRCSTNDLGSAWASATNAPSSITDNLSFTTSSCSSTQTFTLTCNDCTFSSSSRAVATGSSSDTCFTPTIGGVSGDTSTITFSSASSVDNYYLLVTCT